MTGIMIFRNDLRLTDNETLHHALAECDNLVLLYILESRLTDKTDHGLNKIGRYRAKFLKETLTDLKARVESKNGKIFFAKGDYDIIVDQLKPILGVEKAFITAEYTREEIGSENELKTRLETQRYHNLTLFKPSDLPYESPMEIPDQFTAFRRKTENRSIVSNYYPEPEDLSMTVFNIKTERVEGIYDSPEELFEGIELNEDALTDTAFPFSGGETSALERVEDYIFNSRLIDTYKDTRNGLVGSSYSTKFSPWLANGSLSSRYLWNVISDYEDRNGSGDSTYKVKFELLWRDYFKFLSMKHGEKIFWFSGIKPKPPEMKADYGKFEKWAEGNTDDPFVNANMIELQRTGWMSNRGRQVVASYLTKDLKVDWRMGAELFEELLIDYDAASNYCNWQYQAGVGVDSRPYRKFNPRLQAERYDSDGKFRKLWLGDSYTSGSLFD